MAAIREAQKAVSGLELPSPYVNILSPTTTGKWELNLPLPLVPYQAELEALLNKVFGGPPDSAHDLKLAKQLALNWCDLMCRRHEIELE